MLVFLFAMILMALVATVALDVDVVKAALSNIKHVRAIYAINARFLVISYSTVPQTEILILTSKGIRDQVISKSNCVCGVKGRHANNFVPNNAVRDIIKQILKMNYSSAGNRDQVINSLHCLQP